MPVDSLDDALLRPSITHRFPRLCYTIGECGITNHLLWPEFVKQFVPRNDSIPVGDQVREEFEHLRLDHDNLAGTLQLIEATVKGEFTKCVHHASPPVRSLIPRKTLPVLEVY